MPRACHCGDQRAAARDTSAPLVVHETMHWLERCSGKGIDFDHSDPVVWEEARASAQRAVILAHEGRGTSSDRAL